MLTNIIIIGFTLLGVRNILFNQNGVRNAFIWIIWGFCLGYRTFETIPYLFFHPIEIFSFACIIRLFTTYHLPIRKIPVIYTVTFGLFFIRLIVGFEFSNMRVFNEFKNISFFYQLYFISRFIKYDDEFFLRIAKSYLIPAIYISIFGIIEYLFPDITSSIFGYQFLNIDLNYSNIDNRIFGRLSFLFWGTHLAANIITPIFPILLYLKSKKIGILNNNILLTLLIFLFLTIIYLSGNRVSWLILTVMLINTLVFFRSSIFPDIKKYSIFIISIFITFVYSLPATQRYYSIFNALSGNIDSQYDASSSKRLELLNDGIYIISNNIMGVGWGNMHWVHSDLIQILGCAGIIPGSLFIISLILLFIKTFRTYNFINRYQVNDQTKLSLFICINFLAYVSISLILNGNYGLIQCGAPIFILWIIVDGYTSDCLDFKQNKIA